MRNYVSPYPNRHHTIPTMMHLQAASEELFAALPAEFSKSEFNTVRFQLGNRGISFASARKYGIIVVVREEPCKREVTADFWTNPVTGEKYTMGELDEKWSKELAAQFGVEYLVKMWNNYYAPPSFWGLPHEEETHEVDCYRNIFRLDVEKFKSFL
jgi:hypothetical protein